MIIGLWNYAIKAADLEKTTEFHVKRMGAEMRLKGEVFGCKYNFIRLGDTRVLIFDRAPYEEQWGMNLPPGFLHAVYEVDDHDKHIQMLREAEVHFLMEPQEIETQLGRRKIAFFKDPDGVRTEVMEIIEDWSNV
jgi:extradiol dioxygenase family protein